MLNLQLLNPNRIQIVTFLPYNMQTIEHQLLTKTKVESVKVEMLCYYQMNG